MVLLGQWVFLPPLSSQEAPLLALSASSVWLTRIRQERGAALVIDEREEGGSLSGGKIIKLLGEKSESLDGGRMG